MLFVCIDLYYLRTATFVGLLDLTNKKGTFFVVFLLVKSAPKIIMKTHNAKLSHLLKNTQLAKYIS